MAALESTLRWGDRHLPLPAAWNAAPRLAAEGLVAHADPAALIAAAVGRTVELLSESLGEGERVALIVPDRTRPMPLAMILPALLDGLAVAGIAPSRVTVVPASGIHRPMSSSELEQWIGTASTARGVLLAPHDADQPGVLIGRSRVGDDVVANPAVAGAGALVTLGRVVFHYIAGFGGGRKMLVPGIATRRTVLAVHRRCLATSNPENPLPGRHPRVRTGLLEGNPVHEAACAAAAQFPPAVAWHVLLTVAGELSAIFVGDLFLDHERAAAHYAGAHRVRLPEALDAVIVTAGGHPIDRDLVQSHKALDAVNPIVRDGGTIVLVARCGDGIGNAEVAEGLALGGVAAIETALRRRFRVGVHTALALREKTTRCEVLALAELSDEALALAGMTRVGSLDEAAERIVARHGATARLAIAPAGGSLLYELGVEA